MAKDQFHVEMEDISMYPLERSADYYFWEEISFIELNENTLINLSNDKLKTFFGVIRNGGAFKLNDYYYRIRTD
jgi:hypothetical protein